jgi:hypothetical protein
MRLSVRSFMPICFVWIAPHVLVARAATILPTLPSQSCAPTSAQAAGASNISQPPEGEVRGTGYRVSAVRWDPLLQRKWIMISTCGHPELPATAVLVPDPRPGTPLSHSATNPAVGVHAGDLVRLWRQEQALRIELSGFAEESAATGRRVRVRVLSYGPHNAGQPHTLLGIVRGVRDVEITQ